MKNLAFSLSVLALGLLGGWAFMAFGGASVERVSAMEERLSQGTLVSDVTEAAGSPFVSPVVVELFTSQGCSSCPPADDFLGELAELPGVIALSYHVDYWDYIGWNDPFASAAATARQHAYREAFMQPYVYTPQIVVDGRRELVGSRRGEVLEAIEAAARAPKPVRIHIENGDQPRASVVLEGDLSAIDRPRLLLVTYEEKRKTAIRRGENAGLTLTNSHVVREIVSLEDWDGARPRVELDLAAMGLPLRSGCAVLLQDGPGGPVLGAAMWDMPQQ